MNKKRIEEKWKQIPDTLYEVSDFGNVRRIENLKLSSLDSGYRRVTICGVSPKHKKTMFVHSLVMLTFVGRRESGMQINHKDGNKLNNCLSNLEYVTSKENSKHAVANGLIRCGKRGCNRKINDAQRNEIINCSSGYKNLARSFGISIGYARRLRQKYRQSEGEVEK